MISFKRFVLRLAVATLVMGAVAAAYVGGYYVGYAAGLRDENIFRPVEHRQTGAPVSQALGADH